jgi:hypothetical protein
MAGTAVLGAFAAAPASALSANTSTNPASSALGPISKNALSKAVAEALRKKGLAPGGKGVTTGGAVTSPTRTGPGTYAGAIGAPAGITIKPRGGATKPGANPAGTTASGISPAGTGTPTVTNAPPANSITPLGARSPTTPATTGTQVHRKTTSSTSTAAIVLAALAALLALLSLAWAIARWQAYEPHWTVSMRHAMAEAGFRASATWSEFTDWARLGR